MYLKNIHLNNFRNYTTQDISLINGINLFVGDNAQGKTNIIESIYFLAFGKSYRAQKDSEIINFNSEYSRVILEYNKLNIDNNIELYIDTNSKKILKKNGVLIKKITEHVGEVLVVIFSPDSLDIVKGSPAKRRKFIDMICCQLSKSYLIVNQEYQKCLKLKNSMLKNDRVDEQYLDVLHSKMSDYIYKISQYRKKVIEKLQQKSETIILNLTQNKENIKIVYTSDFLNKNVEEIKQILDKNLFLDKIRRTSIKGIQKDDIEIYINDLEVNKYGSQGQNRTALLTLKLANFEVLKEEKDDTPILLLDDIMSELDENRIHFLLKYIENYQSIITTTDKNFVRDVKNIKILKVLNGRLEI